MTGVELNTLKASFQNGQLTETFTTRLDIIGQGPGNNASMVVTAHLMFNADGTMTVSLGNLSIECK